MTAVSDNNKCLDNGIEEVLICEECNSSNLAVNEAGFYFCTNCGLETNQRVYDESVRRAFNKEERINRLTSEPVWVGYGCRTYLSDRKDAKGRKLSPDRNHLFNRLRRIQSLLVDSLERNFFEARPKLYNMCSFLNLPLYIRELAWKIYSKSAEKRLTMGRSIEGFVAASIYAAVRAHKFPRTLTEVLDNTIINKKSVSSYYHLVVNEVLPELNIKIPQVSLPKLISHFGGEMHLSPDVNARAISILKEAFSKGLNKMGMDPKGWVGAALYLAAKKTYERRTQRDISSGVKITEVTLRTRVKEIEKVLKEGE